MGANLDERNSIECQCGGQRCNANELCIAHEKWDPEKPRCAAKFNSYSIQNAAIEWIAGLKLGDTSAAEAKWGKPEDWDVSQVDDISKVFQSYCTSYPAKKDWSQWNKYPCKDPDGAKLFNANLSQWDVSNVKRAESAFGNSLLFDSDVSEWNVAKMENINRMFGWAPKFNSDVSKWDVRKVTAAASFLASSTQSLKWATTAWCKSAAYGERTVENHMVCCMKGEYLDPALTLTYYDFKNEDTCTKCPKGKVQGVDRVVVSSCVNYRFPLPSLPLFTVPSPLHTPLPSPHQNHLLTFSFLLPHNFFFVSSSPFPPFFSDAPTAPAMNLLVQWDFLRAVRAILA
jgi:hypothetical protein